MAASPPPAQGRIFISYRREETAYPAGWLYDRLADRFGGRQVFKDIDSIQLGDDFVEVITRAVGSCDVLLALIGQEWLTITDEQGRRRLDSPDDFVRLEIEAALARKVRVIPILVDGARMPRADELPDSLTTLVRRQALELSPARFDFDTSRLLRVLDATLVEVRTAQDDAVVTPAPPTNAPHRSTTEPPDQREHVEQSRAPSLPPAAPAPPGGAQPPSERGQPPDQRRRRTPRARVLAGVGVAVVLVVAFVAFVANSGTTPSPSVGAATTSTLAGTTTTSPPASEVVFRDDFSGRAAGWEGDGAEAKGAGYTGGAYRISAPPATEGSGAGSVPTKASRVYPSAPSRIRIAVQGRRLPASDQSMGYGILCRINGDDAYVLTISDEYASIEKWGRYKLLKETHPPQVNPTSPNDMQAVCTGGSGSQAVHLELWVNGRKVVETTDRDAPLPTGGVGLVVTTYRTTRASLAEFDNFVVRR
jgi:hypothetical protein